MHSASAFSLAIFLSTLPARGATTAAYSMTTLRNNFYPRSPRGERRGCEIPGTPRQTHFYPRSPRGERRSIIGGYGTVTYISIHAPREGSDKIISDTLAYWQAFLSTLPARGATGYNINEICENMDFYPRSPRGERLDLLGFACFA